LEKRYLNTIVEVFVTTLKDTKLSFNEISLILLLIN